MQHSRNNLRNNIYIYIFFFYCSLYHLLLANMKRVRINCVFTPERDKTATRDKLLLVFRENNVKCSSILSVGSSSFDVLCNSDKDTDNVFSDACLRSLAQLDCSPWLPPYIKAMRSVILRRLDSLILEKSNVEFTKELESQNPGLRVDEIYRFANASSIKVTYKQQNMVQECLQNGLLMYSFSIPAYNISKVDYADVKY